jgi:hypothetical protein
MSSFTAVLAAMLAAAASIDEVIAKGLDFPPPITVGTATDGGGIPGTAGPNAVQNQILL